MPVQSRPASWQSYWINPIPRASLLLAIILTVTYLVQLRMVPGAGSPRDVEAFVFSSFSESGPVGLLLSRLAHPDFNALLLSLAAVAVLGPIVERWLGAGQMLLAYILFSMAGALAESYAYSTTNRVVFLQMGASTGTAALGGLVVAGLATGLLLPRIMVRAISAPKIPGLAAPAQLVHLVGSLAFVAWHMVANRRPRFFEAPEWLPLANREPASFLLALLLGAVWFLLTSGIVGQPRAQPKATVPR